MKKKRKLISILSSIFGIGAICGLFTLLLFNNKDAKAQSVNASDIKVQTIQNNNFITNYYFDEVFDENHDGVDERIIRDNFSQTSLNSSYSISLYKDLDSTDTNRYRVGLTYYGYFHNPVWEQVGFPYDRIVLYNYDYTQTYFTIYSDYFTTDYFDMRLFINYINFYSYYDTDIHQFIFDYWIGFILVDSTDTTLAVGSTFDYQGRYGENATNNYPLWNTACTGNYNTEPSMLPLRSPLYIGNFTFNVDDTPYNSGYTEGYSNGYLDGYNSGYNLGYDNGYESGYNTGTLNMTQEVANAYNNGYNIGYSEGINSDSTVHSIFTGILEVGMLPINFFLAIFNFEILGINIASFISALFSVLVTIWVVKFVIGYTGGGK